MMDILAHYKTNYSIVIVTEDKIKNARNWQFPYPKL